MDIYLPKERATTLFSWRKKAKPENQNIRQTNIDKYRVTTQLIFNASPKENFKIRILNLDIFTY